MRIRISRKLDRPGTLGDYREGNQNLFEIRISLVTNDLRYIDGEVSSDNVYNKLQVGDLVLTVSHDFS